MGGLNRPPTGFTVGFNVSLRCLTRLIGACWSWLRALRDAVEVTGRPLAAYWAWPQRGGRFFVSDSFLSEASTLAIEGYAATGQSRQRGLVRCFKPVRFDNGHGSARTISKNA